MQIFVRVTDLNTGKATLSCSINYSDIHPPEIPGKKNFCSSVNGVKLCICMYASTFKMQRKQKSENLCRKVLWRASSWLKDFKSLLKDVPSKDQFKCCLLYTHCL